MKIWNDSGVEKVSIRTKMIRLMSLHQLIMMRLSLVMILVFVPVSNFRENSVLYRIYQLYNMILSIFIVTETVHTISRPISIRRLSYITAQIEPNRSLYWNHFSCLLPVSTSGKIKQCCEIRIFIEIFFWILYSFRK